VCAGSIPVGPARRFPLCAFPAGLIGMPPDSGSGDWRFDSWAAAYSYDAFVAVLIIAAVAGVIIKQRLFPSDRS
jgi:hypothetical protein